MMTSSAPGGSPSSAPSRPALGTIAFVALIAVAVRLIVVFATHESGLFADMIDYHDRATLFARGESLRDSFRGPGYPLFVAVAYLFPGTDLWAARVANALLGGVAAALTIVLASRLVRPSAAVGAGVVSALYPASVLSATYLMPETLYGVLLLAAIVPTSRLSPARAAIAGACAGFAALTRSLGLALVPSVLLGHLPRHWASAGWRRYLLHTAIYTGGCLLVLAPWLAHTRRVSGSYMMDSNAGLNVLLGANPRARERLEVVSFGEYFQQYVMFMPNETERNQKTLATSWRWIRDNPGRWLLLMPRKAVYLFGLEGREHVWLYSHAYFGPRATRTVQVWAVLLVACFPLVAVPAAFGLARPGLLSTALGTELAVLLVVTTLLHMISFGETRFHLPLVPFLACLAARGVADPHPMSKGRIAMAAVMIAVVAVGWWAQWPEIADQFRQVTGPEGWKTNMPY